MTGYVATWGYMKNRERDIMDAMTNFLSLSPLLRNIRKVDKTIMKSRNGMIANILFGVGRKIVSIKFSPPDIDTDLSTRDDRNESAWPISPLRNTGSIMKITEIMKPDRKTAVFLRVLLTVSLFEIIYIRIAKAIRIGKIFVSVANANEAPAKEY